MPDLASHIFFPFSATLCPILTFKRVEQLLWIVCTPMGPSLPLCQRQTHILQLNRVIFPLLNLIKNCVLEPAILWVGSFQIWQWSSHSPMFDSSCFSHLGGSPFNFQVFVATKNLLYLSIQNQHPDWNRSKVSDKLLGHDKLLSPPFIYVAEGPFAICFNFFCRVKPCLSHANSHFTHVFSDLLYVAFFADLFFFLLFIRHIW